MALRVLPLLRYNGGSLWKSLQAVASIKLPTLNCLSLPKQSAFFLSSFNNLLINSHISKIEMLRKNFAEKNGQSETEEILGRAILNVSTYRRKRTKLKKSKLRQRRKKMRNLSIHKKKKKNLI